MQRLTQHDTEQLHAALSRLIVLMQKEVVCLQEMKLTALVEFQEEKTLLIEILSGYVKLFEQRPEILKTLPKDLIAKLKVHSQVFDQVVVEEGRQLLKARRVHDVLMDTLKHTWVKYTSSRSSYTKTAHIDCSNQEQEHTPPLSVCETV